MDNYRPVQGQDYGILRKKEGKEEELFVFGYSCKIYEDYDKSLYVDQGKHLIPWLGDESLKIDRYDCRGALNDLTKYLPKSESFDRYAILSNEEKRIEQLCDQERYRALTTNEEDEFLYQEEELKRLQQALSSEKSYSEVGFSYDNDNKPATETPSKEGNTEEEDEAFIPPYQLDVPVGMKIPKSKKHHEIIERTAFFIHDQGPQMEILLKIKQAENPQFNFLSFDNELHPYYRHLLMAVKNQRYKPTATTAPDEEEPKESSNEDTYLHPSLIPSSQPPALQGSAPKIPIITYKPSTDCSYSALVNRIKGTQTASLLEGFKKKYGLDNPNPTNNNIATKNDTTTGFTSSLPLSALTKSARRRRIRKEKHKAQAASFKIYYAEEEVKNQDDYDDDEEETPEPEPSNNVKTNTESNDAVGVLLKPVPAPAPVVQLPPTDMQLIIDKMASYVAKNGRDFENVVRSKGDPRFLFLDKSHVYNPYYNQKVELYLQLENPQIVPAPPEKVVSERPASVIQKVPPPEKRIVKKTVTKSTKSSKSKQPIPICFSIKKPKDQEALEIKSALPYEESEPEEDEENEETGDKSEEAVEDFEKVPPPMPPETMIPPPPPPETPPKQDKKKPSDMTLEKWAQERLRAKLVTAAKEKLAAKAAKEKDKQLQAERRKKAAEFINLLQKDNLVNKIQSETTGNSTSNGKKDSDVITIESDSSVSDSDSVVSVPISEEEEKQKQLKRKSEESNRDIYEKTKRRFTSFIEEKNKYKTKHRDHATNHNYSPPYSKHSHSKYRKYDKEKRSHSKKKKHRHSRDDISSSSSSKKSHKDHHKSKRSRYPSDDSELSDRGTSSSSGTDSKK